MDPVEAALLAELTVVVLHVALDAWLDDPVEAPLADVMSRCFVRLRAVLEPQTSGVL